MQQKKSAFDMLASSVQRWIWKQGWTSLNEIQERSIPIILKADSDVIISAATAGGKTEAALFPILTSIDDDNSFGCKVLYVSPLKALINDQYRRLLDITEGTHIKVTPWHQDVSVSLKNRFLKTPSGILIITPESLESFLMNRREIAEYIFESLQYIVIDELHAFIGTERGIQLQSLLSRVETMVNRRIPRIAMSATFSDFDSVKVFLRNKGDFPCSIITKERSSHEVKILIKEYIASDSENGEDEICNEILNKLRGTNNLVFVNSKYEAEEYTTKLGDLCSENNIPNEFRIHHGNLSREIRGNVERELQEGRYPVTAICTSTLELGIDIGKVKSIAQIGVANSVSGLRQRLGRSGRRNEPSILRILSIDGERGLLDELRTNLFQNIAVVELLKEHQFETSSINNYHFSTLIQQLLSLIVSYESILAKEAWQYLCMNGIFNNVTSSVFLKLLHCLGEKKVISQLHTGEIIIGWVGEKIIRDIDFYATFMRTDDYTILDINGGRIGIIQGEPRKGDIIKLAAKHWKVEEVSKRNKTAYVHQTDKIGNLFFDGFGMEASPFIVEKMKEVYCSLDEYPYLDMNAKTQLKVGRNYFSQYALDSTSFIEYNERNTLFTWAGYRINHTIELILKQYLEDIEIEECNAIYIVGVTPSDISFVLKQEKPKAVDLASLLVFELKLQYKYDYLLTDELLNMEYAKSCLDIDGAWNVLENVLNLN